MLYKLCFNSSTMEVGGSPMLANAIDKFQTFTAELKKRGTCLIITYFRLQNLESTHLQYL